MKVLVSIFGMIVVGLLLLAATPIKETHFVSPVKFKVRLAGSFGELRGRHFHAGLDIKSNNGRSGDSIFSAEKGYISRIRIQRAGYTSQSMSTMPMVTQQYMPTLMASMSN